MMSLLVLVVLGGMLAAASPMIVNEVKMNTINRDMIDAQFAAEAGAKVGIAAVYAKKTSSELDWLGKQQNLTKAVGRFTVRPNCSHARFSLKGECRRRFKLCRWPKMVR